MMWVILNESWRQYSAKHQLYGHQPPISKTIVRWTRHAGHCYRSSKVMLSDGPPHIAEQKQDDQLEHAYSSFVRIRDIALGTCQKRWTIGRSDKRGSGISMLAAQDDDDDDEVQTWIEILQNVLLAYFPEESWDVIVFEFNQLKSSNILILMYYLFFNNIWNI